ncbi:hypothetical protein Pyn_21872 [Prunus yedoensis var. nudiflora]|uniref:Uncharacterized protein n=1 Tax=Prunus yedoensis var. nudiflora TaxID=2094558 RepID=A0A314XPA0_PRUYE|nr:hypothetical protein Pyn_21872 [Prunus yedoensis var. nudiflora]
MNLRNSCKIPSGRLNQQGVPSTPIDCGPVSEQLAVGAGAPIDCGTRPASIGYGAMLGPESVVGAVGTY